MNEVAAYQVAAIRSDGVAAFRTAVGSVVEATHVYGSWPDIVTLAYAGRLVASPASMEPSAPYLPTHDPCVAVSDPRKLAAAPVVAVAVALGGDVPRLLNDRTR